MSELPLPEDLSLWPSDPFQLLKVTRQADETELKRAYQRLLRVYRPERYPEEFRKLRDAYDTAASWVQRVASFRNEEDDEPTSIAPSAPSHNTASDAPGMPHGSSPEGRVRAASESARRGEMIEAYAQFNRLTEEFPLRVEPYLACYWMLRLEPQLDGRREPREWLRSAVKNASQPEQALTAYLAELEHDPRSALDAHLRDEALASPSGFDGLRRFQVRWRAAAQLDDWQSVETDLQAIQNSPWWLDRDLWTAVMTAALEATSFSLEPDAQAIVQWCRREIDRYPNMHFSMFDALGRLDYLLDLATRVRALHFTSGVQGLRRMLSLPSSAGAAELYVELVALIDECEQSPGVLLKRLSQLADGSPILPRFQELLDRLCWALGRYDETDWQPEDLRHSVGEFLAMSPVTYAAARAPLLVFCLGRMASPHDIATAIAEDPRMHAELRESIATPIREDQALYCAFQAFRIFET